MGALCPSLHRIPVSMHSVESPFLPVSVRDGERSESVWAWRGRGLYHCVDRGAWKCVRLVCHRDRVYSVGRSLRRWDLTAGRELPSKSVSSMLSSCRAAVPLLKESRLAPPEPRQPSQPESLVVLVACNTLHRLDLISLESSDTSSGSLRARLANASWQFTNALVETQHGEVFAFCKRLYHVRNVDRGDASTVGKHAYGNITEALMLQVEQEGADGAHPFSERCIVATDKGSLWEVDLTSGAYKVLLNLEDTQSCLRALFALEAAPGQPVLFGFSSHWLYRINFTRARPTLTKVCHNAFGQPRAVAVDRQHFARTGRHRVFVATDVALASLVLPTDCLSDSNGAQDDDE
eukprot:TRINITY_DN4434_c0_g1_i1.p1 TRINITY_DN4434_c0_g1~~TRINITY_DN4434_c0_g1_i1.p1  ORF type:complete len:364 (+),score=141.98 TRINITY_DN4434_c0_g1_i1:46-1092(+)